MAALTNAQRQQRHREAVRNRILELERRIRELEAENAALQRQLDGRSAPASRAQEPGRAAREGHGDYRADVIRGIAAIARALGVTPVQIRRLQERHGLPTFRVGKVLCARAGEIDEWRAQWQADSEELAS
jgi:hypothetical protein